MAKSNYYHFGGMATAYNEVCDDDRIIEPGAFDWQDGYEVPLVWKHRHGDTPTNVLGHALLSVSQNPPGIRVKGRLYRTPEGNAAKVLIAEKRIKSLSIWANKLTEELVGNLRHVLKGTIREVSLVPFGANPGAQIEEVFAHSSDPLDAGFVFSEGLIIHSSFELEDIDEDAEPVELPETPDSPDEEPAELEESGETQPESGETQPESGETQSESGDPVEEEPEEAPEEESEETDDLSHAGVSQTIQEVLSGLNEDQTALFDHILTHALTGETPPSAKSENESSESPSMQEVFDSLSEDQKQVLYYLSGTLGESIRHDGENMTTKTTHNVFEDEEDGEDTAVLAHAAATNVMHTAIKRGSDSLKADFAKVEVAEENAVLQHSVTGMSNLFPEYKDVHGGAPMFYQPDTEWVEMVLAPIQKRGWSKIKSQYADISGEDARARGYVTGAEKFDEVFEILSRTTSPQTIYKKQSFDRDDIVDFTDFDFIGWVKGEMQMKMREEIARAVLIGDGRATISADKIKVANIRPVYQDAALYTHPILLQETGNETEIADMTDDQVLKLIDDIAASRQFYRGKGSPTFYTSAEVLTKMLLVRDTTGRRIHETQLALNEALRVSRVVEVSPMSNITRVDGDNTIQLIGIVVNMSDYVIGMTKGGETNFFDDFDINFNKLRYLYETRLAGALVSPKAAISIELVTVVTP